MSEPIPMIIFCPMCKARHIDKGEFATKPHHTHACQGCGFTWRPAVVPTVGVEFLPGFKDTPSEAFPPIAPGVYWARTRRCGTPDPWGVWEAFVLDAPDYPASHGKLHARRFNEIRPSDHIYAVDLFEWGERLSNPNRPHPHVEE